MARTLYDVLGVGEDADEAQIKRAWRDQAKDHHPDRNPGEEHLAAFRLAKRAYDVLSDADKRRRYDGKLARLRAPAQVPECVSCGSAILPGQTWCPLCALQWASRTFEGGQAEPADTDRLAREYAWVADPGLYEQGTGAYREASVDQMLRALISPTTTSSSETLPTLDREAVESIVRRLGEVNRWMRDLRRWFAGR